MRRRFLVSLGVAMSAAFMHSAHSQPVEVTAFAAGSLRAALTEAAAAWQTAEPNARLTFTFGASGLLKDRLLAGERADVFASANMEHPEALAAAGRAAPPKGFARNQLCALVQPGLDVSAATLIERLLDPAIRVGTSTPKADPSGDYAWAMFDRIDRQGRPGAFAVLSGKALQLTGGPNSPRPPGDRNVYAAIMADGQADIFITYCTNAVVALREVPALRSIDVPADVNVSALYGAALMNGASPAAARFVGFLLAPAGAAVLARHGFASP